MTKSWLLIVLTGLLHVACKPVNDKIELKGQKEKDSYSVGYQVGSSLRQEGAEMDSSVLAAGIRDALEGKTAMIPQEEMSKVLAEMRQRSTSSRQKRVHEQAEKNLEAGRAFLESNKTKEGVTTLASGLQYKVITEGTGPVPKASDTVTVHYRGTLSDGTEFDSSYGRGEPAQFRVDQVIKGWTEALLLMKQGSKWQLYIPADLAYGPRGAGPIGPNSTLLFDVELISIGEPSETQPSASAPASSKASAAPKAKKN